MQVEAALRTGLQLRRYDDVLDPNLVYSFIALVGFYSSFYGTCSKVWTAAWHVDMSGARQRAWPAQASHSWSQTAGNSRAS